MRAITSNNIDHILGTFRSDHFLCCIFPAEEGYRCSDQRPPDHQCHRHQHHEPTVSVLCMTSQVNASTTSALHHSVRLWDAADTFSVHNSLSLCHLFDVTCTRTLPLILTHVTQFYTETKPHICPITACITEAALARTTTHTTFLHVKSGNLGLSLKKNVSP